MSRGTTTNVTLKAVHGFEDSGKLVKKQKIVDETEARKERKGVEERPVIYKQRRMQKPKSLFSCQHYTGQMSGPSSP